MDSLEHQEQTRQAFGFVKRDIQQLQQRIDTARAKLESVTASFEQYPDKKEFYAFIETVRSELDRLEQTLASKNNISLLSQQLANNEKADKQLGERMTTLEHRIGENATKEELRRAEESRAKAITNLNKSFADLREESKDKLFIAEASRAKAFAAVNKSITDLRKESKDELQIAEDRRAKAFAAVNNSLTNSRQVSKQDVRKLKEDFGTANKELSVKLLRLENEQLRMHEDMRELRRELRLRERQLDRFRERAKSSKTSKSLKVPWRAVISIGLLALLLFVLITVAPKIFTAGNQTGNQSSDLQKRCVADYECKEVGQGSFYSNCTYNEAFASCTCDTVTNQSLCNINKVNAANESSASTIATTSLIIVPVAAIVLALVFLNRKKPST